jgi:zinc transport system substrate-binding protein
MVNDRLYINFSRIGMMRIYLKSLSLLLPFILCCSLLLPAVVFCQTPMPVAVSIIPQKYFVEKIGGQLVEIEVMVPPGATPEQYEPKPKQMAAVSKSKIYFACGVPFDTVWLPRIAAANPKMLVVHTEKDIEKRQIEAHSHEGHAEHAAGGHAHAEEETADPHVWLSPPLVMLQARAIFEALAANDPLNRQAYEKNYKNFISELVDLDLAILRIFQSKRETASFMVFHPAWGYFADAYGLNQVPVEVEGKEPKAKDLDNFIKRARELKVKTIFVQPQYSPRSAQTIADAIGGKLVHADDLAPDWANNLRQVAEQIAANLGLQ